MANANRTRAILAQQKVKQQTTPQPLPDNYLAPKLTQEERKKIYGPKPATEAPQHLQGNEWIRAWRTVEKITYGLTAFSALLFGGLVAGESKKAIKKGN
jgi:hypothetical protein